MGACHMSVTTRPAVGWFEITGPDGPALQPFYFSPFGWRIQDANDGSGRGLVEAADRGIPGGIGSAQPGRTSEVTSSVEVHDTAPYLEKVHQLGGSTVVPP